jgi:hypothetical protein
MKLTCELDPSQIFEQFAAVDGQHFLAEALATVTQSLVHVPVIMDGFKYKKEKVVDYIDPALTPFYSILLIIVSGCWLSGINQVPFSVCFSQHSTAQSRLYWVQSGGTYLKALANAMTASETYCSCPSNSTLSGVSFSRPVHIRCQSCPTRLNQL